MYLKAVYIQGFKSFATKTKIEFNQSVTAIVGPNGSGKSNITDAIMWVLGETSAKSLRGSKMEDVIFTGTDKRKPLGLAEVTIVFDNSDKTLDLDYTEVSVTRRMYRSLESEFLINNTKCRLKDIKQLFMDTGIGKDGYSLIGQGKIESILSDKPEERRAVFEEAAGISKYKYKKIQSQHKLQKTEENLIRLNDIILEITQQEENLRRQSTKAQKYLEIFEELKNKEITFLFHKTETLQKELENLSENQLSLETELTQLKEHIDADSRKEEIMDQEMMELSDKIENNSHEIYNYSTELQKSSSLMELYEEKNTHLEKEIQRIGEEQVQAGERKQTLHALQLEIEHKMEKLSDSLKEYQQEKALKEEEKEQLRSRLETSQTEYEQKRQDYQRQESQQYSLQFKQETLSEVMKEKEGRKNRLQESIATLSGNREDYHRSLSEKKDSLYSKQEKISSLTDTLEKTEIQLQQEYTQLEVKKTSLQNLLQRQKELHSKLKLLQNLEDNYEGYNRSVKSFMNYCKKRKLFTEVLFGPVGNHLKVASQYEKAISVALGAAAQNIIVSSESIVAQMISILQQEKLGRITFLPISRMKLKRFSFDLSPYKSDGVIGFANDLIEYPSEFKGVFQNLLGKILVVNNFQDAQNFTKNVTNQFRIVTLAGDLFHTSGSITGGSVYQGGIDLLTRKSEIDQLQKQEIQLVGQYEKEKSQVEDLETKYNDLLQYRQQLHEDKMQIQSDTQNLEQTMRGIEQSLAINEQHFQRSQEEFQSLVKSLLEDEKQQAIYQEEMLKLEENLHSYLNENGQTDEKLRIQRENLKELESLVFEQELTLKKLEEENKYLQREKVRLGDEWKTLCENEEKWKNAIVENRKNHEENLIEIGKIEQKLKLTSKEKQEKEISLQHFKEQRQVYQNQLKELRKINDENREKLLKKNSSLEKTIAQIERKRDFIASAFSKIQDDYHLQRDELEKFYQPHNQSIKESDIMRLKKSLSELGDVNLSAIEEHGLVKERLEFNLEQKEDLLKSREEIKNILNELDDEMKKNFKSSFEIVAKYFNEIFQVLFNGGKASIELEGDLLEGGIEIKAQPPGKKFQSLSLLSGGERALTAVALLFSLLKVRPAPFCILDEIDAALDDANIKRYAEYLLTIDAIQFIIITHRKLTMEIANAMYGVTMEEKGVSKLFSVELNQ